MTYCKKGLGLSAGAQVHVSGHVGGCLGGWGAVSWGTRVQIRVQRVSASFLVDEASQLCSNSWN